MFRKTLSWLLAGSMAVALLGASPVAAKSKAEKEAQWTAKVKAGVTRLGVGSEARVKVKLRDGRKLAGYVKEAGDESFVVADAKTGETATIPYP
ncbi:MAG: hypothetical protein ACREEM_53605, partial [Blastocatellia bacterium]